MSAALQGTQRLVGAVILRIDSLAPAHDRQKHGASPWVDSLNAKDLRAIFLQRSRKRRRISHC